MKRMLLFAVAFLAFCAPTHAFDEVVSLEIQGMRFYSVKTINLQPGDGLELVASVYANHSLRSDVESLKASPGTG